MYASVGVQTTDDIGTPLPPTLRLYASRAGEHTRVALKCKARASDFRRKLPEYFQLRQELVANPSRINTPPLTSSFLLSLPYDIIHLIFVSIQHAPSQICLLLTCKRLYNDLSSIPLTHSLTSPKYAGRLPRSVFDVPVLMMQLSPWIPSAKSLRLCNHCLTFRPAPPSATNGETSTEEAAYAVYWSSVAGCGALCDFWIQKTGWEFHGGGWHKVVHDICPMCHFTCSLADFNDCDGCGALGRMGDVDFVRVSQTWRQRTEDELRAGRFAT